MRYYLHLLQLGIVLGLCLSRSSPTLAAPRLPTLYLIGDSTVNNGTRGLEGWGTALPALFDLTKINVVNRARGGRSSRTFLTEGLWDKVAAELQPGDYVLMQFGHNDGGSPTTSYRASLKGNGDETQEVMNKSTGKSQTVHSYGWYLRQYIAGAKAKGATPIVLSLVPRNIWNGGKVARSTNDYHYWASQAALAAGASFINLNGIIADHYDALGEAKVKAFFPGDHTHTNAAGAALNAASVVEAIRKIQSPLMDYLTPPVEKANATLIFSNMAPATHLAAAPVKAAPTTPTEAATAQRDKTSFKFAFGSGPSTADYLPVSPITIYSKARGYGFEPGAAIVALDYNGLDALHRSCCTSDKPFFFSVALPEGNYRVTVTLGDRQAASTTTIKAELRRLMSEHIQTAPGQFVTRSFIVNTRTPQITGGGEVHLKGREKTSEIWNWDDKLTLEFNDTRPCVCALEVEPMNVPTVFLLGDSTVCDQPLEPWNSWGQMLPRFFKPEVAVANHAESGESLRSSRGAKRLDKVQGSMKAGDYLFIQYGHNDTKEKGAGVGAFTSYTAELKHFVTAAREHGGIPVLVTSMNRKSLGADGKIKNTLGDYPEAVRRLAQAENVSLIDLNAMSKTLYEALGPQDIGKAFQDGTHHNAYGSYELAKCVVEGIKTSKLDLAKYIADDFQDFDPAHPDPVASFHMPVSPMSSSVKPDGN